MKVGFFFLVAASLSFLRADSVCAQKSSERPPSGPFITIYAPHPERFELALDEVEIDWSGQGEFSTFHPIALPRTKLVESRGQRAVFTVSKTHSLTDVAAIAAALKAVNPDTEVHLVLYVPGLPRSRATRRLLTREVGLLLEHGRNLQEVLGNVLVDAVRPVPGVPNGYVVETQDPRSALDVADVLRQHPGVQSVYPLLKQFHFPR